MSGNPLDKKSQGWSALFSEPMDALVQRYTSSVAFDRRLWRADIAGSLAHAERGTVSATALVAKSTGVNAIRNRGKIWR